MAAEPRPERIALRLVAPVLLALVAAMALAVWLVERSAAQLNLQAEQAGQRLARTLVEQNLRRLEQLTYDNAWWDEAVANLVRDPDPFWASENVGWYWHETFEIDATVVVDAAGQPVLGFVDGAEDVAGARAFLGDALEPLLRAARATASDAPGTSSAVVGTPAGPAFVGLSLITPEYVTEGFPAPSARSALIAVQAIDAALLEAAAEEFQLAGLALLAPGAAPADGRTAQALFGPEGATTARLAWTPPLPGADLRDSLLAPLLAVAGLVLALFGVFVFVSNRVAARLHAAKLAAESASDAKSRFLANVSHELRTPLNAILGFSEMIKLGHMPKGREDSRQAQYATAIHQSGQHLLDLIEDILDLSKIESGRQELCAEPLDVAVLMEEARSGLAPLLEARGHTVNLEVPAGLPPLVADRRAVRQILYNLLNNAAKFTPPGGRIAMGAGRASGGGLELFVRDNGIGIAAEDLARVRRPFEQVADPRGGLDAAAGGGTGLGLSIVEGLVALHGGALHLDSNPGRGTRAAAVFPSEPRAPRLATEPNRDAGHVETGAARPAGSAAGAKTLA